MKFWIKIKQIPKKKLIIAGFILLLSAILLTVLLVVLLPTNSPVNAEIETNNDGGGVNLTPGITNPSIERELTGGAEKPPSNPDQEDEDNGVAQAPSASGVSVSREDLLRMENLKQTYDSIPDKVFVDNGPITAPNTAWPDPWIINGRPLLTVEQAKAKVNFQQERKSTRRQRMADQALRNKKSIVFENLEKSAETDFTKTTTVGVGSWDGYSVAQFRSPDRLSTKLKRGSLTITLNQEIQNLLADYYPDEETDTWTDAIRMEKLIALGFKKLRGKVTFNILAEVPNRTRADSRYKASISQTINWELNLEANSPQKILTLVFADREPVNIGWWYFGTAGLYSDKPSKITFVYRDGALVVTNFVEELAAWIFGYIEYERFEYTFGTTLSVTSLSR